MEFLPASWADALVPNYQIAYRFHKGEVSPLENISIRVQHLLQAAWSMQTFFLHPVNFIGHSLGDIKANADIYYSKLFREIKDHVDWALDPEAKANDLYNRVSKIWKLLAACVLGLAVLAVASIAAPGLAGRIGINI